MDRFISCSAISEFVFNKFVTKSQIARICKHMKFKFRQIINQHQQRVYSLAFYMLRDAAEAEDVTQEVYTRLWRDIERVQTGTAGAWLSRVTRNLCIDHIRKHKGVDHVVDHVLECTDHRAKPAEAYAASQLSQWIHDAIDSLKEPYRSLILMAEVQQKTSAEIAQVLALNTNQIKVYAHRARLQLREKLKKVMP